MLLFDENLSPKSIAALANIFLDSAHVHQVGLGSASDHEVWSHARVHT
jgi:predicted nuclease of predicted toxin-antitoxin system